MVDIICSASLVRPVRQELLVPGLRAWRRSREAQKDANPLQARSYGLDIHLEATTPAAEYRLIHLCLSPRILHSCAMHHQ
jgi:hypothetical protein